MAQITIVSKTTTTTTKTTTTTTKNEYRLMNILDHLRKTAFVPETAFTQK